MTSRLLYNERWHIVRLTALPHPPAAYLRDVQHANKAQTIKYSLHQILYLLTYLRQY